MQYYQCINCNFREKVNDIIVRCPKCGSNLFIDYDKRSFSVNNKFPGIWKYYSMLPDFSDSPISLGEGRTPLIRSKKLSSVFGIKTLYIKDETRNPTGAFTDRGASVIATVARKFGINYFYCLVGGDLLASLAAYSSFLNAECVTKKFEKINRAKLYQVLLYGVKQSLKVPQNKKVYYVSPADPFIAEGYKTISIEIVEELNDAPDAVIVPVGSGALIFSIWKGFKELLKIGVIRKMPKLFGVQESTCSPLVKEFQGISKKRCKGIATEINEENPVRSEEALKGVRDSKGLMIAVNTREIINGIRLFAKNEGLLVEPASAATLAALRKILNIEISSDEVVVVLATGAGLKDPRSLVRALGRRKSTIKGRTKLLILKLLLKNPLHAYAIWSEIKTYGINLSKAAIYQHLNELEKIGIVQGEYRENKKIYYVTKKGKELLND